MGRTVLHADALAFQIVKRFKRVFLGDHHRRVSIVRVGKGDLLATLWGNVHAGDHRIILLELQRWDQ